jgi:hypothetical protein
MANPLLYLTHFTLSGQPELKGLGLFTTEA